MEENTKDCYFCSTSISEHARYCYACGKAQAYTLALDLVVQFRRERPSDRYMSVYTNDGEQFLVRVR